MSYFKNGAAAQLRITPAEKSHSEIVCLIDGDLAVRTSLLESGGFLVRPFNKPERFFTRVEAHPVLLIASFTKLFHGDQRVSAVRGALAMSPVP